MTSEQAKDSLGVRDANETISTSDQNASVGHTSIRQLVKCGFERRRDAAKTSEGSEDDVSRCVDLTRIHRARQGTVA
jgi:hypothetical protein